MELTYKVKMKLIEIKDFTGYFVSDDGYIYSTLQQGCRNRYDLSKRCEPKRVKERLTHHGYARVYIRRDSTNKREDVYVHRVVAEYFVPNPDNKDVVNHKNCVRNDNIPGNLEWVTTEENIDYAFKYGDMGRDELGRFAHK